MEEAIKLRADSFRLPCDPDTIRSLDCVNLVASLPRTAKWESGGRHMRWTQWVRMTALAAAVMAISTASFAQSHPNISGSGSRASGA
jgi:hypothetical protein